MPKFEPEFTHHESQDIAAEFQRLGDNTYLDHAGTTLYSERQIDAASLVLKENLFCNPHSCKTTGDLIDQVRFRILKHFNTNATDYTVIFVANATAALKLVAECFEFSATGRFYYCQENHTSVLGMREIVQTDNIFVLPREELLQNLNDSPIESQLCECTGNSLLVFSAQCNFSGYKMPLKLINRIQKKYRIDGGIQIRGVMEPANIYANHSYICLDAASFVATNHLDLQKYKSDFVCISFYKMFGFPTGVGALLVSTRGQNVLKKKYFGGGTVEIAMTRDDFHEKRNDFTNRFEDGTLPFLSIASILEGFNTLERLIPTPDFRPINRVTNHVFQLAKYCYEELKDLRYGNGSPLMHFYNHFGFTSVEHQGGIVTFNVLNENGNFIGFAEIACLAALHNIQLRTGCFCNPGACQVFLELSNCDIRKQFEAGHICSDYNDLIDGTPTGAVRLSFGYMTQLCDVEKVVNMFRICFLNISNYRLEIIERRSQLPKILQDIPQRLCPKLKSIRIYPIKSCGPFEVNDKWKVTSSGLEYDRIWLIVDEFGRALTQKQHARMCLIKPKLDILAGLMELAFPEMNSINIPLEEHSSESKFKSTSCQSKVCSNVIEGLDCGDTVAEWLENCLEYPGLRLIRHKKNATTQEMNMSLANKAQFLLINRESANWLATKMQTKVESIESIVDRFRANLIIETSRPFDENNIDTLIIGDTSFKNIGPCTRCQMICIDQKSGQKTTEPFRTIAHEFKGKIRFGIYLSVIEKNDGILISCNDIITLKEKPQNA